MKLTDISLNESVTFAPSKLVDHPKYGKVHDMIGDFKDVDCRGCKGTGEEEWSTGEIHPCRWCKGSGKTKEFVTTAPEMNVANRNASVILDLLGLPNEDSGTIYHEDLPELRRKIIRLINSDAAEKSAIAPTTDRGELRRQKVTGDDGVTSIVATRGPTMMDGGLKVQQVEGYLTRLLNMVTYAQEHGYNLGWA